MRRSILGMMILAYILSGCSGIPLLAGMMNNSEKTSNPSDLFDDFSDKKSGWETLQIKEGSAGYVKGTYQINVIHRNTDIFTTFTKTFVNNEIAVKASRIAGSDDNNYGVICRYLDANNFYAGQISSDGTAGIFKVEKGKYKLLGHDFMIPVPAILGGNGVNEIRLECLEDTLTLSVNGSPADSQKDSTFRSGEIGLIAGTISGDQGTFQFDDFFVVAK